MTSLPHDLTMGAVSLSVGDLPRSLAYYHQQIGLSVFAHEGAHATLGVGKRPLLHLEEIKGAKHHRGTSGLYHFAIRVPSRPHLAQFIMRLMKNQTRVDGASDHLASEALYLSDPDGHGIEVYRDRPRDQWRLKDGKVVMDTLPLDIENILADLPDGEVPPLMADGTDMGHVHLHVGDLAAAEAFYIGVLGFEKIMKMPSALFISVGGYHHHLGLNTWAGIGAPQAPAQAARLLGYEIVLPDASAIDGVQARLGDASISFERQDNRLTVNDPAGNRIWVVSAAEK
jgi:catechol 2,3-dioxygenase